MEHKIRSYHDLLIVIRIIQKFSQCVHALINTRSITSQFKPDVRSLCLQQWECSEENYYFLAQFVEQGMMEDLAVHIHYSLRLELCKRRQL